MKTYTFWNNKGGTGKTSLCFKTTVEYASQHLDERILVLDMCPQANLSELLAGGLVGNKIGFVSPERRYEAPTVARPPQM